MSHLNIIYDLELEPVNFGILASLVCCDIRREDLGLERCRLFILMSPTDGFRNKSARDRQIDIEEKYWRLWHITKPAARLLPTCDGVLVFDDRAQFQELLPSLRPHIAPKRFSIEPRVKVVIGKHEEAIAAGNSGQNIQRLKAPPYSVSAAQRWKLAHADEKPMISITLRQSAFHAGRNSNISQWIAFAEYLQNSGFTPVFVPDTEAVIMGETELPPHLITNFPAAIDIELRTAFYEVCDLNFFVGNGPCLLPQFNKHIDYILCNLLIPGFPNSTPAHFERIGLPVGSQMPGQENGYARIVWETDSQENLIQAFEQWRSAR